jgi:hypothetical protein
MAFGAADAGDIRWRPGEFQNFQFGVQTFFLLLFLLLLLLLASPNESLRED